MAIPAPPGALFANLGDAVLVEDADEEVSACLKAILVGPPYCDSAGAHPQLSPTHSNLPPACASPRPRSHQIMDLYIGLEEHTGGLGYLDGRAPELSLTLELVPTAVEVVVDEHAGKRRMRRKEKVKAVEGVSLDVVVTQDPGALRARSGETGSVLWRSR